MLVFRNRWLTCHIRITYHHFALHFFTICSQFCWMTYILVNIASDNVLLPEFENVFCKIAANSSWPRHVKLINGSLTMEATENCCHLPHEPTSCVLSQSFHFLSECCGRPYVFCEIDIHVYHSLYTPNISVEWNIYAYNYNTRSQSHVCTHPQACLYITPVHIRVQRW